jgi:hypothetical protein
MRSLPPPIRHYLGQGKYSVVAQSLMTKYALHVDQGSILEREIMLLLMGIENPNEFVQTLGEEAKLDQQTIKGITEDVNAQIFIPLREEIRKAPITPTRTVPVRPVPSPRVTIPPPSYARPNPIAPPTPVPPPLPTPTPTPPPPAPRRIEIPPSSMYIQANPRLPSRPSQSASSMLNRIPPPVPKPPTPARPTLQPNPINRISVNRLSQNSPVAPTQKPIQGPAKTVSTNRMLEDHEEPHIEFKTSLPRVVPPPSNLPGTIPPQPKPIPFSTAPSAPAARPLPQKQPVPPPVSRPPNSPDPYREPIEEE